MFSSSHSQPAITNSCTSTTTDDDFIWSTSPSDDNVTESSIDFLAAKADADRLDVLEKELAEDIGKLIKQRAIMCWNYFEAVVYNLGDLMYLSRI